MFLLLKKTLYFCACKKNRGVAQLVARYVRDVEVAGSSLVTPTFLPDSLFEAWFLMSLSG